MKVEVEVRKVPVPETMRLVDEARPVLEIEKSVVVPVPEEDEAIAKRKVGSVLVEVPATMVNCAYGEEVPRPTLPVLRMVKSVEVENFPPELVEEEMAKRDTLDEEAVFSMVRVAYGEEVPRPKLPVVLTKVN